MIIRVVGIAIVASVTAFLLRGFGWKGVPVFITVALAGIFSAAGEELSKLFGLIENASGTFGVEDAVSVTLKVIGIGYLSGICADVCRELDASTLAGGVLLVGRIEIIMLAVPYFIEILKLGGELIG